MSQLQRIAIIPGDGIGREVMPEGQRVLATAVKRVGLPLDFTPIDWASCDWYAQHGQMMPDNWKDQIGGMDAILFGAVGWPAAVPDHVSLWGSLLKFRREFDQYINLRPARLFEGVPCPLANRKPGEIDMLIVRENTEGEYSAVGGVAFAGTEREFVVQESIFTRHGSERLLNYAFNLARSRERKHVTVATKSNGIAISMPWWDERAAEAAARHPDITWDKQHIDILAARFVLQPQRFDVVAATNLFGDILSDLGPACTGTIGIAPSANLNPERTFPSMFEPIHGSAFDIMGQGLANPVGTFWSAVMMLEHLGETDAAQRLMRAIEQVTANPALHTRDLGGPATTAQVTQAVCEGLVAGAQRA